MTSVRDTFLHLLNDNISPYRLHPLRRDPDNREADSLMIDAVNVQFLNLTCGTGLSAQQVVLDVVFNSENDASDCVEALFSLLQAAYFTPIFDYTNPDAPTPLGTNVMWDRHRITFKKIASEAYSHYSCLLSLKFHSR